MSLLFHRLGQIVKNIRDYRGCVQCQCWRHYVLSYSHSKEAECIVFVLTSSVSHRHITQVLYCIRPGVAPGPLITKNH